MKERYEAGNLKEDRKRGFRVRGPLANWTGIANHVRWALLSYFEPGDCHVVSDRANHPGKVRCARRNYETVMMLVQVPAYVNTGLHTHPGFDAAYLLEGHLTVLALDQPDRAINPGESWHVPPGVIHEVRAGRETVKVLAAYVVEKGKPLATSFEPAISN